MAEGPCEGVSGGAINFEKELNKSFTIFYYNFCYYKWAMVGIYLFFDGIHWISILAVIAVEFKLKCICVAFSSGFWLKKMFVKTG